LYTFPTEVKPLLFSYIDMQEATTPLMKQYQEVKAQFPDMLVLFQVGDFYELFFDDAKTAASFLGITLTKRGKSNGEPIPLCGVPVHTLDHYITKLIRGGFKVALCDQLEQATPGKMVARGVTRVFTPGTLTESTLLQEKKSSYLFSFFPLVNSWGLLFGELMTAQLFATMIPTSNDRFIESELIRFFPDEVILPATKEGKQFQSYFKQLGYYSSLVDFNLDDQDSLDAVQSWLQQFNSEVRTALDTHQVIRMALYHFYGYLRSTQESSLTQFNHLQLYKADDYLIMDAATQRNLELVKNSHDGGSSHTLFSALDASCTAMGSRMIRKWLMRPLVKEDAITQRLDVVQEMTTDTGFMSQLQTILRVIGDCERVVGRIALRRATLADYLMLSQALSVLPQLQAILRVRSHIGLVQSALECLGDFSELYKLLMRSLNDDTTQELIVKQGFDESLDRMRDLVVSGNQKIVDLESREQQATGIGSLKIRYNSVHGYSIEITKTHYDAVPERYVRRQTLVGRERFTTQELQQLEYEIAQAHTEIGAREQELFSTIKQAVAEHVGALRKISYALAHMDALLGLATVAYEHGYVRPVLTAARDIRIKRGRHPIVERTMTHGFIPNDTLLTDEQSLWIVTGPNMGGKSTYLRQVGLICIMAHCGSFVPAGQADIPLLDRIFTRIGSGDNLVGGKSTFMVDRIYLFTSDTA
jgi:DNA mismatch repair protein MutS